MQERINQRQGQLAYFAGFFDGEGSICISPRMTRKGTNPCHRLTISVSQLDPRPLYSLKAHFGGVVYQVDKKRKWHNNPIFRWQATDNHATQFLQSIVPFLIVKKAHAEIGIAFQSYKTRTMQRGYYPLDSNILSNRESYRGQLLALSPYKTMKAKIA